MKPLSVFLILSFISLVAFSQNRDTSMMPGMKASIYSYLRIFGKGEVDQNESNTYNFADGSHKTETSVWRQYSLTPGLQGFTVVKGNNCGTYEQGCSVKETYNVTYDQITSVRVDYGKGGTVTVTFGGFFSYMSSDDNQTHSSQWVSIFLNYNDGIVTSMRNFVTDFKWLFYYEGYSNDAP